MYVFTAGIIDDLEETIQVLMKVINLPLSIVIVQVKNDSGGCDVDVLKLEEKCQFLFERASRKFLKVINYNKLGFRSKGGTKKAMVKLTS